jgi:RHS repeat-associated protein
LSFSRRFCTETRASRRLSVFINHIGVALFEETRASAGAGAHTATQSGDGAPTRGAATAALALDAPSGDLIRRGVASRTGDAFAEGNTATVNRPAGVVADDLIVALIGVNDNSSNLIVGAQSGNGWTLRGLLKSATGEGQTVAVFTKVAGANEPNFYTFAVFSTNYFALQYATIAVAYGAGSNDTTPPTAPGAPTVNTAVAGGVSLTWTPASDTSGIAYYRVHRSTTSGFTPGPSNEIGQTTLTTYADNGDGSTNGLPAGTYFYKLVAVDGAGNVSVPSGEGSGNVSTDTSLAKVQFSWSAPATLSTVSGTVTLDANATPPPGPTTAVTYGFDPSGFRSSRTVNGQTTRFLLGGLIETTTAGAITGFDVDGPAGDLAHYTTAPSSAVNPTYSYYSGHGDLAAEADHTGTRTRMVRLDPWGQPLASPGGGDLQELYTGRWDKKHDLTTSLIEMGVRPYEPALGRFLAVDPVDGGSANEYDYADQDPVNSYDLHGTSVTPDCGCGGGSFMGVERNSERAAFERGRNSTFARVARAVLMEGVMLAASRGRSGSGRSHVGPEIGRSGQYRLQGTVHSSRKRAQDAAQARSAGRVVEHKSPRVGPPHFHATTKSGELKRRHEWYKRD